jgi:NAD(P)-dependent dehydrogenase (short-subunit alcohol dehydrogenase family)
VNGKVVVITGASSGIGKAAATEIARRGAHVVITARDRARGEAALHDVRERSGNPRADLLLADFASLAEVRRLAAEAAERYPRIDVLVNNAGLMLTDRCVTIDGFETQLQVNHLAPFVLTSLLLPTLRRSAPARIVNVASTGHKHGGPIRFDDLQSEREYRPMPVYMRTKLANVLFTRELARRLAGTGVTANSLHPGAVSTGWAADGDTRGIFPILMRIARPFMLTPERGAETVVYLACSPEVEGVSGRYFARCREARVSPLAEDDGAARRLWEVSAEMARIGDLR